MNRRSRKTEYRYAAIVLISITAVLVALITGCGGITEIPGSEDEFTGIEPLSMSNARVQMVAELQEQYSPEWMENEEIVGTAIGRAENGELAIVLMVRSDRVEASELVPQRINNIPIISKVTGPIVAIENIAKKPTLQTASIESYPDVEETEATDRYERPVPIGVSAGNMRECSAGTIGVRVRKGDKVYALSNNHVFALENAAPRGSLVLQPGRYDNACNVSLPDAFGYLSAFKRLRIGGGLNFIDAAIARTTTDQLGNSTLPDGYGTPMSTVVPAEIGQAVQKYGRTTSLTMGTVTMVNAFVMVQYTSGTALFVGQIVVEAPTAFILSGDSGSLLVTQEYADPVGLLFAGDEPGTFALANPIQWVLDAFRVTIDGVQAR